MKNALLLLAACLFAASCAPSTPQARIQQHPEKFAALNSRDKSLVEQGRINRGMSRDAVWLAWGPPSQSYEGSKDGKASERWDYAGSYPVYTTGYHGWGGWGGYYPYRRGYYPYGFSVYPEVTYIPYRRASVWFVRDRVDSWERQQ